MGFLLRPVFSVLAKPLQKRQEDMLSSFGRQDPSGSGDLGSQPPEEAIFSRSLSSSPTMESTALLGGHQSERTLSLLKPSTGSVESAASWRSLYLRSMLVSLSHSLTETVIKESPLVTSAPPSTYRCPRGSL